MIIIQIKIKKSTKKNKLPHYPVKDLQLFKLGTVGFKIVS